MELNEWVDPGSGVSQPGSTHLIRIEKNYIMRYILSHICCLKAIPKSIFTIIYIFLSTKPEVN